VLKRQYIEVYIHCLDQGRALCERPGPPSEWREGEVWLSKADWPDRHKDIDRTVAQGGQAYACTGCTIAYDNERKQG